MATRIAILTVDCRDADLLANFWCRVLGWQVAFRNGPDVTITGDDAPFRIDFMQMPAYGGKAHNKLHLDLVASDTDQQTELDRLLAEGARPMSIGKGEITWHVLADPEGNEFCLLRGEENLTEVEPYHDELSETDLHNDQSNRYTFDTSESDFVDADFGKLATPTSLVAGYPVEEYSAVEYSLHTDTAAAEPAVPDEPAVQTAEVRHEDAVSELHQVLEPKIEPDLVVENEPAVASDAVAASEVADVSEPAESEHAVPEHPAPEHTEPELMSGAEEKVDESSPEPEAESSPEAEAHVAAVPVSIDDGQLDVELADEAQEEYESAEHHEDVHSDIQHSDIEHRDDVHGDDRTVIEHQEEQLDVVAASQPAPPVEHAEPEHIELQHEELQHEEPEYVEPEHAELDQDGDLEPVESVEHSVNEASAAKHHDSDSASAPEHHIEPEQHVDPEQHIEPEVHAAPDQHTSDLAETTLVLHGLDFSAEENSKGDEPVAQHDSDHESTTNRSVSSSEDQHASSEPADDYGDAVSELRAMIRSRMSRIN